MDFLQQSLTKFSKAIHNLVEDQESEFLPEISASMLFKNVLEN
jgi:hypothetical protein